MTSVGTVTRAQSPLKSIACCSVMRDAMRDGIIGAAAIRTKCRSAKPMRDGHESNAASISGQNRNGPVTTNAGAISHGRLTYFRCRSFGRQPGAGEEARISDVTRAGRSAANRTARNPPYDTPQIAARVRPVPSMTASSCRT